MERLPPLDRSIPKAARDDNLVAAQTLIARNTKSVLDIVVSKERSVDAWFCYARPKTSKEWVAVNANPDVNGRHVVPVPRTTLRISRLGRRRQESGRGEVVWRMEAQNAGARDVLIRLIVRLGRQRKTPVRSGVSRT